MVQPSTPPRPSAAEERKARLAANLRANLKRRKAQARAQDAVDDSGGDETEGYEAGGDQPLA